MSITLSGGIPTWFVDQFPDVLYHVCQQKDSKFGKAVRVKPLLNAEDAAFDMMGGFSLTEKGERSPQTPILEAETQRRWVSTTPYHNAVLFDKDDDLSMIIDPTSDFVTAFRRAVNRKKDDIILAAFEAAVTSGRRAGSSISWDNTVEYTGKGTGRVIDWNSDVGNCVASDTGMTVEKIELALEYFANNDVDDDIPIWCAISPRQFTQLRGQEEYVNIDYQKEKPLATGRIVRDWLGINWIVSSKVVVGLNNGRDTTAEVFECWCWAQDAIILGVQDAVTVRISERADLSYSQQVYVHTNMGAMRMDEDKVIKIECKA